MELGIQLVIWGVFGAVVAVIAQSRGRSAVGWFFVGLIAPCIGIILVLVLPDMKREQAQKSRLQLENRRLRERVMKDRQVSDQRHADTIKRLGAHDAVLGVDTGEASGAPPLLSATPPEPAIDLDVNWHYAATEESGSEGPVTLDELRELWAAGEVDPSSLVWSKGMDDWIAISELSGLDEELRHG